SFLEHAPLLEQILLKNNHLETLPPFLADCTELRSLDLSGNPFRKIELNLERLVRLEELDLKMQPQQTP
ncbi:MAG: leucine-rich repeat domain-containing protein, partial [Saprospiraceae bacterium]